MLRSTALGLFVASIGVVSIGPHSDGASARARLDARLVAYERAEARVIGDAHALEHLEAAQTAVNASAAPPLPVPNTSPDVIGQWGAAVTPKGSITGIHAVVLSTGKVLLWAPKAIYNPDGTIYEIDTGAELYDPATKTIRRVDPPADTGLFCAAATVLGDGSVLVVGGLDPDFGWSGRGNTTVVTFDPISETWTAAPAMNKGRWYPSVVSLADGTAMVLGGRDTNKKPNNDVEYIGPLGAPAPTVVGQLPLDWQQGLYPKEFLLPDGRVFSFAGTRTDWIDPATWRISGGPVPLAPQYSYPGTVILPLSQGGHFKVAIFGGMTKFPTLGGSVVSTSVAIDLSDPNPAFSMLTPLPQPRTDMNAVQLPDGTVVVVGGAASGGSNLYYLQTMLYDPATDTWTPAASQAKRRTYHSTAVLLPDGRVLSAGDNLPGGGGPALEIYSPPYLFKGTRPKIVGAPTSASAGDALSITTDVAVSQAVLVAPGATTHATDNHQRLVRLAVTPSATGVGLDATIPSNGMVPRGPYMLFVLDANGVPSVATWIQVG